MNKITITCEDRTIANALALWLESGDALEHFKQNRYYAAAIRSGSQTIDTVPDVTLGGHIVPHHRVAIQCMGVPDKIVGHSDINN